MNVQTPQAAVGDLVAGVRYSRTFPAMDRSADVASPVIGGC
jgi:hypothetical protein